MNIQYKATKDLIPYSKNAKKHPAEQVRLIANSIREFGFQQPLVVDRNNVVVIGHGRLLAAKRLKIEEVPVVVADELSDEQIRALRLADNSVAESDWDLDRLMDDISDMDINLDDFGLDKIIAELKEDEPDAMDEEEEEEAEPEPDDRELIEKRNALENQERRIFYADNYYGIPTMSATHTVPTDAQLLRFCDWAEVDDPENWIAHFYYDDFKFIQAWRNPDKYIEKLSRFKAVIAPDFSLFTDFPRVLQILSCFRRQWCGAYWQEQGLDVIPDVVWGDRKSFDFCFLGIPEGGTVAVSTLGVKNDADWNGEAGELFRAGYDEMIHRLAPETIIFYGDMIDGLEGNIIRCPSFYEQKRQLLNRQKEANKNDKT